MLSLGLVLFISLQKPFRIRGARLGTLRSSASAFLLCPPLFFLLFSMQRDPLSQALPDAASRTWFSPTSVYACLAVRDLQIVRPLYVLFLMFLVWSGDIGAYYVGRAIGKHKLAPRISPGKTWEGAVASAVVAVIVGLLSFPTSTRLQRSALHPSVAASWSPGGSTSSRVCRRTFLLPAIWFAIVICHLRKRRSPIRRPGRIGIEARRGTEGFRHASSRTRWRPRPHRRAAFRRPRRLIFYFVGMNRYFAAALAR